MTQPIYLDYNATTPVDPGAAEAMLPYLTEHFGNASSSHSYGFEAARALATAREQTAALIGASPDEIVFTGGGSEGNNLVLKGVCLARLDAPPHVVSTVVEHPAVLATLRYLKRRLGVESTFV